MGMETWFKTQSGNGEQHLQFGTSSKEQYELMQFVARACVDHNDAHLRELIASEKDGRLVVLPCKVGDTAYVVTQIFNGSKTEWKIGSRKIDRIGGNEMNPVWMVSTQPYELHFFLSEFGKTVFPPRAEAEKALEEQK